MSEPADGASQTDRSIAIDASAIVAILRGEPEAERFLTAIATAQKCFISAVTVTEVGFVVVGRTGPDGRAVLDRFIRENRLTVVPFDAAQAALALTAFDRFGKGRHPAGLNLGDCCAYALAASQGLPLLYKGADFPRTDLAAA